MVRSTNSLVTYKSPFSVHSYHLASHITEAYEELWDDIERDGKTCEGRKVPSLEEIHERLFPEFYNELKMDLIDEAIDRNDHETVYGYTKAEFIELALGGQISDDSLFMNIDMEKVFLSIHDYLVGNKFFYEEYNGNIINAPVVEVW